MSSPRSATTQTTEATTAVSTPTLAELSEKQPPVDVEAHKNEAARAATNEHASDEEATWDGPDDPENPYNWSFRRKMMVGIVCSSCQLVTTMSASMVTPALGQILKDLHMGTTSGQVAFSVFFLGLGFAPFVVAPLSEMYGRKPVWVIGNVWYILWNALCPVGFSAALMIVGRLMSAAGASVGVTLSAPVLADMFDAHERGKSLAISSILPYIGPALGPIVGGLAAQHVWWPWLFWILSIFDAAVLVVGYVVIKETHAPTLLRRRAAVGRPRAPLARRAVTAVRLAAVRIGPGIMRPVRLLTHRPVVQLVALALGVEFGIYTLVLGTFASLWTESYHQSETVASLHYIAIAIGAFVSAQAGAHMMDAIWKRMREANPDQEPTPEYRLPYIVIGLLPSAAALFWYGWTAEYKVHWLAVDVAIAIFTCGGFMLSQGLIAYQVDEFTSKRAASASAATRLLNYVLGFAFPIFAPQLYKSLGYGWGTSLLGFLYLALELPIVTVLWFWGKEVRAMGRRDE